MRNPHAMNGAPMGETMCACGHVYVSHVKHMPSPPTERSCLKCDCTKFSAMSDADYKTAATPTSAEIYDEYARVRTASALL